MIADRSRSAARTPTDLLERGGEPGARLVLLALVDELGEAARGLTRGPAGDAPVELHAALRRLRNGLRVYRHLLPRRRVRVALARLRRLSRVTGEAAKAWSTLVSLRAIEAPAGPGVQRLVDRQRARARRDRKRARRKVARALPSLLRRLRHGLERCTLRVTEDPSPSFAVEARAAIERVADRLSGAVMDARDPDDRRAARRVRRRAMALRDLLESLAIACPALVGPLGTLGKACARLGAEHQALRLVRRIDREVERAPRALRAELIAVAEAARSAHAPPLVEWLDALEPAAMLGAASFQAP